MPAPENIRKLVERFEEHREAYRLSKYNEAQLRREFLDPFLEALGWDIFNKQGYAEAYKEVIHEDSLEVEGAMKAPDYAFRVGGQRKFFVEAKKPSVNIQSDIYPAFQLRRYSWSAKLPLGVLSDFEEFAIYDCRSKPDKKDKSTTGRVAYYSFREYVEKWDEIADIFSREAVLKGSFDKYAEGVKGKKGTTEVDDAFLTEIERWREVLARNFAIRNPSLTTRELNYAVQMTIDRIIFLRICEDRGIERYEKLKEASEQENVYAGLCQLFQQADARYNSGLFHFKDEKEASSSADSLTLGLSVDDKVLREILGSLYYPESPYVFSEIPSDILGQVYERFLGKVIRLTAGHQAKVEEKPEVRKAGGVYYTPTYIVEYIVKNTVGKLLEGKTPREVSALRILDPACGSGTFPLGAFQYLLDWHLKWYIENDPEKLAKGKAPAIFQSDKGWMLTTAEKKRILLNNIYGVDIDPQAVEVTKLSLLLKVLENESEQTIGSQLALIQERALPDLGKNIKCGNSLIGPDYYEGHQLTMGFVDDEERYRVNAFDWKAEFPQVFIQGGFDAVVGNPPYVRQEGLSDSKKYFQQHYKTYVPTADLYVGFIEKAIGVLKHDGLFGMIVSNKWLRAAYGESLRNFLTNDVTLIQVIDLAGLPVFEGATVRTVILICSPVPGTQKVFKYLAPLVIDDFRKIKSGNDLQSVYEETAVALNVADLKPKGWAFSGSASHTLISNLQQKALTLTNYIKGKPFRGVLTGLNEAFVIGQEERDRLIASDPISAEIIKPLVRGRDIKRWGFDYQNFYLIFARRGIDIKKYDAVYNYLLPYKQRLTPGIKGGRKPGKYMWYEIQDITAYWAELEKPKIIYPDISTSCRFCLDKDGYFGSNTTYFIPGDDLYLLGILNSSVAQYYFTQVCAGLEGGGTTYLRFFGQYIENFPVRPIDFSDPADKARHDKMVSLVERMLELHKQSTVVRSPLDKERVAREIESTDKSIDRLVYELYGLSEEEIRIVEGK
jgi:type I restriction-modification system DNA methylase subunit